MPDSPPAPPPDLQAPGAVPRGRVWAEVLVLYLGTCLAIRALRAAQIGLSLPEDVLIVVALLFMKVPDLAERWTGWHLESSIVQPVPFLPALRRAGWHWALAVLAIYPAFLVGHHLWQSWGFTFVTRDLLELRTFYRPHHPDFGLPPELWKQAIYQLVAVGYAEEWFYRGYMQSRLDGILPTRGPRVLGVVLGPSFWVTAVLFTLGHSIVTWQWWQPFIFFPSLVFGWLRIRTGNILAGSLFHAFANTAMGALDHIYGVGR